MQTCVQPPLHRTDFRGGTFCESCDKLFHCHITRHWTSHSLRGHKAFPTPVLYVGTQDSLNVVLIRSDGFDDDGLRSRSSELEFNAAPA
jgi:hypothetical protein